MLSRFGIILTLGFFFAQPAGAHPVVYVTNCCSGGSSVSVLDTSKNKEVAGIAVGANAIAVAVAPDGLRAYAANSGSNTISVMDTASHRVVGTISTAHTPINLIVSPDNSRLFVAVCTHVNPILGCNQGAIDVVDIVTGMTFATIQLHSVPNDMKFTPDGSLLVVAAAPALVEIDPVANTIVKSIRAVAAQPRWVVITSDGQTALTTGSGIWAFDLQTGSATMKSSATFAFLGISPDGAFLYAFQSSHLDTISSQTYGIVGSVLIGKYATGLAVSADGRRAYVPDVVSSTVAIVDIPNERLLKNASIAFLPAGLAVTPNGREVYVTNSDSSTISAIDSVTDHLLGQTEAGARPRRAAVTPDSSRVYVANWLGNTISVIDARTMSKIHDVDVGSSPYDALVSPDGHLCYVNISGEGVVFIDTATDKVVASLRYGPNGVVGDLSDLAVSPNGTLLYALDEQQGFAGIRIVDAHTATLIGGINVSPIDGASTMTMRPDGSKLYVTAYYAKTLDIVDVRSRSVEEMIKLPDPPEDAVASPDGRRLYLVLGTNVVGAMDLRTEKIVATVSVPMEYGIGTIGVSPDGSRLFVTGSDVFAIDTATMKIVHKTKVGAVTWGVTVSH